MPNGDVKDPESPDPDGSVETENARGDGPTGSPDKAYKDGWDTAAAVDRALVDLFDRLSSLLGGNSDTATGRRESRGTLDTDTAVDLDIRASGNRTADSSIEDVATGSRGLCLVQSETDGSNQVEGDSAGSAYTPTNSLLNNVMASHPLATSVGIAYGNYLANTFATGAAKSTEAIQFVHFALAEKGLLPYSNKEFIEGIVSEAVGVEGSAGDFLTGASMYGINRLSQSMPDWMSSRPSHRGQ